MAMTKPLSEQVRFTQDGAGAVERLASEKLKEWMSVRDFGAVGDGVADDTAAIQAAISATKSKGGGTVFIPSGEYYLSSTLYVDQGYTSIVGDPGSFIRTAGLPDNTPAIVIGSSSRGPGQSNQSRIEGLIIVGRTTNARAAIEIGTITNVGGLDKDVQTVGTTVERVGFQTCGLCIQVVTQSFDPRFVSLEFEACARCFYITSGGVNYGENIVFDKCFAHNCGNVIEQDLSASQINLSQCVFDYCDAPIKSTRGWVVANNCYLESNKDSNYYIDASGGVISLHNLILAVTGAKTQPIFYSSTAPTSGFSKAENSRQGISIIGGVIYSSGSLDAPLCGGPGGFWIDRVNFGGLIFSGTSKNKISEFLNQIQDPSFSSGIGQWSVSGSVFYESAAMKLVYNQPTSASYLLPARPKENVLFNFRIKIQDIRNRYVRVEIIPKTLGGTPLGSSYSGVIGQDIFNSDIPDYVSASVFFYNLPAGTASVEIKISFIAGELAAPSPTLFVDDVNCVIWA